MVNGIPATRRVVKELPVSYIEDFRGHPACPCQVAWLPVFEAEAQRRGILRGPLPLSQLIGGAPQSGGTHTDGGADDTYPLDGIDVAAYVGLSRQMGADATWERPYNWDGKGGVRHVHRVLTGCPHNGPARYQIDAVRAGLNGLANRGPDTGPLPLSGRTWREGIAWANNQEDDMAQYADQLDAIQKAAEAAAADAAKVTRMLDRQRERQRKQASRIVTRLDQLKDTGATGAQVAELRAAVTAMLTDDED